VIVPTYNEVDNLPLLVDAVSRVLVDFDYEIVVVDDNSPDGTWQVAEELGAGDRRLRVVRRVGRRGLSSAVLEGMGVAEGRVLVVMDADLQHDEAILPDLVSAVLDDEVDVCLGSRDAEGGSYGQFGPSRRLISWVGATIARRLLGVPVGDPMSGFFAVSRARFEQVVGEVNPRGFKILLEFVARGGRPRIGEVGYRFRNRAHGQTKLTGSVVIAYLVAIAELSLARLAGSAMIAYTAVAITALWIRLGLTSLLSMAGGGRWGPVAAIEAAVLIEFVLQDRLTFGPAARNHPWRRGGRPRRLGPVLKFHLVAGYGLLAQLGLATLIRDQVPAQLGLTGASGVLAVATAVVVGSVLAAYVLNRTLTWPVPDRAERFPLRSGDR
jgi:dolichol-phosphate mannosyltransferase